MDISRRTLLAGMAATAAVAALPAVASAEIVTVAPVAAVQPPGWWGYTFCGEIWHGNFDSREEAIADALSLEEEGGFTTGRCVPLRVHAPDLDEHLVEWLLDSGPSNRLKWCLPDWFEGVNEEADWEGDLCDAIQHANYDGLAADLIECLATACFRASRPDLIPALYSEDMGYPINDDAFLKRLLADKQFASEVNAAGEAWLAKQDDIQNARRCLNAYEEVEHPGATDAEDAA